RRAIIELGLLPTAEGYLPGAVGTVYRRLEGTLLALARNDFVRARVALLALGCLKTPPGMGLEKSELEASYAIRLRLESLGLFPMFQPTPRPDSVASSNE